MLISRRCFSSGGFLQQQTSNSNHLNNIVHSVVSSLRNGSKTRASHNQQHTHQLSSSDIKVHYRRPTPPTGVPLSKILSNTFPLTIKESFEDFFNRKDVLGFQHDLLATLPFFPNPDSLGRSSKVLKTSIDKEDNYINEFVIYPPGKTEADSAKLKHLVLLHGYGAGLGFYLKNFDALSKAYPDWCIHAVDLLGYGCSSRPEFKLATEDLSGVESWFHEAFDTWRTKRGLTNPDKLLIAAHSMGAYLTASYLIKYPETFRKLLMISPGAVIRRKDPLKVPKWFELLWERNISPFSLVRNTGPLGSLFVSGWTSRRFAKMTPVESDLLHKYTYGIFNSEGSGEYMLNYLLLPGADARHPLIERMDQIGCDMTWIYGKEDWMDKDGGERCGEILRAKGFKSKVLEVEDSGHHIYLDNSRRLNEIIIGEMGQYGDGK